MLEDLLSYKFGHYEPKAHDTIDSIIQTSKDKYNEYTLSGIINQIRGMRSGERQNQGGVVSSHIMEQGWNELKGTKIPSGYGAVWPSLFQNKDKSWHDLSGRDDWAALDEAIKRNELISGLSPEQATWLGHGGWKPEEYR